MASSPARALEAAAERAKAARAETTRATALECAARLMAGVEFGQPDALVRDLEQVTVAMADRFAEWIATGSYDWQRAGTVPAPELEAAAHKALMASWKHLADDPIHAHQLATVAVRAALDHDGAGRG